MHCLGSQCLLVSLQLHVELRLPPSCPVGYKAAFYSCDCQVPQFRRGVGGWPGHLSSSHNLQHCSVQPVLTRCTTALCQYLYIIQLVQCFCWAQVARLLLSLHGSYKCLSHIFVFHMTSEVQDVAIALVRTVQTFENLLSHWLTELGRSYPLIIYEHALSSSLIEVNAVLLCPEAT